MKKFTQNTLFHQLLIAMDNMHGERAWHKVIIEQLVLLDLKVVS